MLAIVYPKTLVLIHNCVINDGVIMRSVVWCSRHMHLHVQHDTCMSRLRDIQMPIYDRMWHWLTHESTLTWNFEGYKCCRIKNYAKYTIRQNCRTICTEKRTHSFCIVCFLAYPTPHTSRECLHVCKQMLVHIYLKLPPVHYGIYRSFILLVTVFLCRWATNFSVTEYKQVKKLF